MKILYVKKDCQVGDATYRAGAVINVTPERAAFLLERYSSEFSEEPPKKSRKKITSKES